jgi:EmrB/QacA subfamily drug resistance transporter
MINPNARPCETVTIQSVQAAACAARAKVWVLVATILASAIAFIDESVVNIALPAIEKDLGASIAVIQWIVNAYTLSLASLLLIGGAFGDRYGRRRLFVIGMSVFAASSLWCGLTPDIAQLIAARVVQGTGAAMMIPCSLAIIGTAFDETERGKAIGTWAGFTSIAAAAGPLLGGWIVDHATWRAIFFINPILAAPTIWIALRHVPESHDGETAAPLDWRGALLILSGLSSLAFGLIEAPAWHWTNPAVIVTTVGGSLLLVAFVWEEVRSPAPMMPPDLFRSRAFSGINALTLLLYAALGGAFFLLPFLLIQVHGYSATVAGLSFLPFTVIMGTLSRWSGGLIASIGARLPLIVGPIICAAGYGILAILGAGDSYVLSILLPLCVLAFGMVITVAPLTTAVINAVPAHRTGAASGINNSVASVASLLAVAVFGAVALAAYDRALDRTQASTAATPAVIQAIGKVRGQFVIAPAVIGLNGEDRAAAATALRAGLAEAIDSAMALAAILSLAAAFCAWLTIDPPRKTPPRARPSA